MRKIGARRSTNTVYAFKYIDVNGDSEDFLYTPVREMLNSYWCKWQPVVTQRNSRGSRESKANGAANSVSSADGNNKRRTRA